MSILTEQGPVHGYMLGKKKNGAFFLSFAEVLKEGIVGNEFMNQRYAWQ